MDSMRFVQFKDFNFGLHMSIDVFANIAGRKYTTLLQDSSLSLMYTILVDNTMVELKKTEIRSSTNPKTYFKLSHAFPVYGYSDEFNEISKKVKVRGKRLPDVFLAGIYFDLLYNNYISVKTSDHKDTSYITYDDKTQKINNSHPYYKSDWYTKVCVSFLYPDTTKSIIEKRERIRYISLRDYGRGNYKIVHGLLLHKNRLYWHSIFRDSVDTIPIHDDRAQNQEYKIARKKARLQNNVFLNISLHATEDAIFKNMNIAAINSLLEFVKKENCYNYNYMKKDKEHFNFFMNIIHDSVYSHYDGSFYRDAVKRPLRFFFYLVFNGCVKSMIFKW